jgi:hypothetical protein
MIQTYYQSLVWFRHIISHWYDSDILSVIGMIQTYYQSLVWFRYIISHWYDMTDNIPESYQWLIVCLNQTNDWWYVLFIPMTANISESYQWLIVCLNHTNDWWYVLIVPMTDNSHWYDSDISSVIGMIQTYYQSLVWFRHIGHWHDSDISSVIGMIPNDWWYIWIIPITDRMSESYQWLIIYLNHTNDL